MTKSLKLVNDTGSCCSHCTKQDSCWLSLIGRIEGIPREVKDAVWENSGLKCEPHCVGCKELLKDGSCSADK